MMPRFPLRERFGYRKRYFRFGEYYFGPRFTCFGLVLLLMPLLPWRVSPPLWPCDVLVGIALVNLKFGTDVLPLRRYPLCRWRESRMPFPHPGAFSSTTREM